MFGEQREIYERTIEALRKNGLELEEARGKNNEEKVKQKAEIEHYIEETERLKNQVKSWESNVEKFAIEEESEGMKLQKVREAHDHHRALKEKKLNDLTYGIKLYEALGMKMEKLESGGDNDDHPLRFVFTQLLEEDPSKQFSFILKVGHDDEYKVLETSPTLAPTVVSMYVNMLNKDNHIGRFVVNMRKAFKAQA
jgi:Rad3-related DNA helicase